MDYIPTLHILFTLIFIDLHNSFLHRYLSFDWTSDRQLEQVLLCPVFSNYNFSPNNSPMTNASRDIQFHHGNITSRRTKKFFHRHSSICNRIPPKSKAYPRSWNHRRQRNHRPRTSFSPLVCLNLFFMLGSADGPLDVLNAHFQPTTPEHRLGKARWTASCILCCLLHWSPTYSG